MTRVTWLFLIAVGWITVIAGCSPVARQNQGPSATGSVEQVAWQAIADGAPVIDVRTDQEFREGHLPAAVNIPYDVIATRVNELPSDRSQPIVLYCRSGRRSGIAKQTLEELGFTHAINAGGYEAMMRARPGAAEADGH